MASQKQRDELPSKLVSLMMETIGKTYEDAMSTPEFWRVFSMRPSQMGLFKHKAVFLIRKTLRCNRTKAEQVFDLFWMDLGLRLEEE